VIYAENEILENIKCLQMPGCLLSISLLMPGSTVYTCFGNILFQNGSFEQILFSVEYKKYNTQQELAPKNKDEMNCAHSKIIDQQRTVANTSAVMYRTLMSIPKCAKLTPSSGLLIF
jgi:hypothetical protein